MAWFTKWMVGANTKHRRTFRTIYLCCTSLQDV